jgi:hypothetical protein
MANIFPPDYATPLGQLRALLSQTEQYKDPANPDASADYLMDDGQLKSFLALNSDKLYGAAADALLAIAANEALVSKKIRTEDLSTDGSVIANSLRQIASEFRTRQKEEDVEDAALEAFEIVSYTHYPAPYPLR